MKRTLIPMLFSIIFTLGCARAEAGSPPMTARAGGQDAGDAARGNVDLPRFPSISPDGSQIVFSWRGDLWKVASAGGHAVRITSHPGDDLQSAWSPDGGRIAFESDRNGFANIYQMNADGSDVRAVTDVDVSCTLVDFGVDSAGKEVVTLDAGLEGDLYRSARPYMISTDGGDLLRVHNAFGTHAAVSPDGKQVLFTRGGSSWTRRHYLGPDDRDVWLYTRADDSFRQPPVWEGNDGQACWLPGGDMIFLSDRELNCVNVYRAKVADGGKNAKRLTDFRDDDVQFLNVSNDGSTAVLTVWDTLYTLSLNGAEAAPVALRITANEDERDNYEIKSIDRTVDEAALSPDGKVMAFVAYGEVYVRNLEDKSPTVRVTEDHARERHIAWSPDGLKLYFVSDRSGTDGIYAATVTLTRGEIKEEFEKATKPAKEDEADEEKGEAEGKKGDDDAKGDDADDEGKDDGKDEDKKEDDKKDEKPKKKDLPKELQPDRWHDALKFRIETVVDTDDNERNVSPSPDGKSLAFRRGRGDLVVLDIESGVARTLAEGWDVGLEWRWSPDSRHIAYEQSDLNFNTDIWIVPADGSKPAVNITRHPDNDGSARWSADGKVLCFVSERVNEEFDLWMVYLDKELESYTPKELAEYYDERVKAVKKLKPLEVKKPKEKSTTQPASATAPAEGDQKKEKKKEEPRPLDLDDAYLRLRRVTSLSGDETGIEMTPAGDRYVFNATIESRGLYSIKWDGTDQKKLGGPMSVQHMSLTGDKLVVVSSGQGGTISPTGTKVDYVNISDKIRIDLQAQNSQKFLEAARRLGEQFYHPTMKGLDWDGLSRKYHALARQTRTADEFNHVANRILGELNGSHLRISARGDSSPNAQSQGRLGTTHHRVPLDGGGSGFEVTHVVPRSPASEGPMAIKVGDVITAVDLEPFGPTDTVESRLTGKSGTETIVTVRRKMESGEAAELKLLITPTNFGALRQLKYLDWRETAARKVSEWSDGRLGYIHIQGMSQPSLDVFERDLYAAAEGKDGLIIDVRNNGGGWTADRLLSSIMVQRHAYTVPRGASGEKTDAYPQDRLFIQRYTLPINMLCNEKSFSNAEITSHAFKTLKRGTLVGQQTYGGVISTGGWSLIDGTFVRLPFRGWFLTDGTDMENHGAMPDILVPQTPEAESKDDDEQLREAVTDLLGRI